MSPFRVPVALTPETKRVYALVVCDDGAVFYRAHGVWEETTPIPGTHREYEQRQERITEENPFL